MHHSELYDFATSYWWLMFPLGWGIAAMLRIWVRHRQSQTTLDLIKSYIDRGKEPPAELYETILPHVAEREWTYQPLHFWLGALLLGAGAIAFGVLTWLRAQQGDADNTNGLLFITILLGAGAAACLVFVKIIHARKHGSGTS